MPLAGTPWRKVRFRITGQTANDVRKAEIDQDIADPQRIIEQPAAIENSRLSFHHAVFGAEDLAPESVHARIVAEETMRPEVDPIAPEIEAPREAANVVAGLKDHDLGTPLLQPVGCGKAGRPRSDDPHPRKVRQTQPHGIRYDGSINPNGSVACAER